MNEPEEISVLIVGAGPAGLATAYVLGKYGIKSVICDQHTGLNPHPRAHVINTRSMELFRAWGIADAISGDEHAYDTRQGFRVIWKHSLTGEEFGRIDTSDAPPEHLERRLESSPVGMLSCPQDRIQYLLAEAVKSQGMSRVDYDTRVTAVEPGPDFVDVTAEANGRPKNFRARYVVNGEGAGGRLRTALGIEVDGIPKLGDQVTTYFHADLARWAGDSPALLHWVVNTNIQGVFVSMGRNRWTFTSGFDAEDPADSEFTPQRCTDIIREAVGPVESEVDIDVRSIGKWALGAATAQTFRKGRVFLVGDSAHQFPPTGGFGMNTGLADADNLAWKLAAVIQGRAPEALLDSYETERRAVALANSEFSVTNAIKMATTGVGPAAGFVAAELDSEDREVAAAVRERLASEIPEQRPHFDMLDLEIGYVYGPTDGQDPITVPVVGGRLPHKWIIRHGEKSSTLDLVGPGFTLIAGTGWQLATSGGVRIRGDNVQTFILGADFSFADNMKTLDTGDNGAILVRPDGHIAWIGTQVPPNPVDELTSAVSALYDGNESSNFEPG